MYLIAHNIILYNMFDVIILHGKLLVYRRHLSPYSWYGIYTTFNRNPSFSYAYYLLQYNLYKPLLPTPITVNRAKYTIVYWKSFAWILVKSLLVIIYSNTIEVWNYYPLHYSAALFVKFYCVWYCVPMSAPFYEPLTVRTSDIRFFRLSDFQ